LGNITFENVRPLSATAKQILNKRYLWEGEKTWDELVERVVNYIVPPDSEDFAPTKEMIMHRYFVPNSPCLVNAGKQGAGLAACFVVDFKDTIEEIYKTKYDFALIARKGGGAGTTLSKLRPKGSNVKGSTHGYAGGPIAFADTISRDMAVISQGGLRSMAILFSMSVYHPDIIEFILAKQNEDDKKIENANMSVVVDNNFMNLVKEDKTYWTEFDDIKYKEYKARDIFNLIVDGAWRNGEPGLLFQDRINDSPYKYTSQEIMAANPCLYKETILPADMQLCKISKPNGKLNSWKTGVKKTIKLTTNGGHEIVLTPDHQIMMEDGSFIEAKDSLEKNIAWGLGDANGGELDLNASIIGFLFGDGFSVGRNTGISVKINKNREPEMHSLLLSFGFNQKSNDTIYYNKQNLSLKLCNDLDFLLQRTFDRDIPDNIFFSNFNFLKSFVSGLFEANGSVTIANQISFKSTNKEQVKKLQIILSSFGIPSWIVRNKPRLIHWKNGDYTSRENYNLQIAPRNAIKFKEKIGFISNVKNNKIRNMPKKYGSHLKVVSIENFGEQEVWDFTNDIHYSLANGIYAHNCAEQPLPPSGVCNLGSLDLSKFVNKRETDFEKLEYATRLSFRFLDRVIDKSDYPTPEIAKWAKENRAVGLSTMGFADYCLMKQIAYGSDESLEELNTVLSKIYLWSKNESEKLGKEFGVPKECKKLPEPRRNITLTTAAPTGTVSLIAGTSSGLEPIFSEIVIRNDKTGTYVFEDKLADKPYFRCAVSSNGSMEVTWEEHVKVLATAQKNIDSGVSKTINFPNHTHRETIYKAMFMAWENDCKGIAVYRNGSRKQEVLTVKNVKKDLCPVCNSEMQMITGKIRCMNPRCNPYKEGDRVEI
jgi:ribonucleoside-diphosphate reductase alpha chain